MSRHHGLGEVIQGFFRHGLPHLAALTSSPQAAQAAQPRSPIQRPGTGEAVQLPGSLLRLGTAPGQPLPTAVREKMETFFRADFADVRVHVGSQASSIGAQAFTSGSNLYFAPGQYNPDSTHGQQLLGHELAHVVQQRAGRVRNPFGSGLAVVQDRGLEAEAERMGLLAAAQRAPQRSAPLPSLGARSGSPPSQPSGQRIASPVQAKFWEYTPDGRYVWHWGPVVSRWWTQKMGGLAGDYQEQKDGYGVWLRNSAWVIVDQNTQRKLTVAQNAIDFTRPFITHGPQNQRWARQQHGDEGDVNMSTMTTLVDQQWDATGGYNSNWNRPRRVGAAVMATGGGNCQDIAALAYSYLREHGDNTWEICFVVARNIKHAFATIGNPTTDNAQDVVVADAWVRYPKACRFSEHFCRNDGNIEVYRAKTGRKVNRTGTLMSKYWDTMTLPQYVTNLKTQIRGNQPRGPATWNHEYAANATANYTTNR